MKTLFASALLALTLSTSAFATTEPQTPFTATVYAQPQHMKLDLLVSNPENKALRVLLFDQAGKLLAEHRLNAKATDTRTVFLLNDLRDGSYRLKITDGKNTSVKEVALSTAETISRQLEVV